MEKAAHSSQILPAICVLGSWSSGTSAVAGNFADFEQWLGPWLREKTALARDAGYEQIVIKHPLLMLLVRRIDPVCVAKWAMVTRPLEQIEATRKRRRWQATFGEQGAKTLYPAAFSALVALEQS